MEDFKKFLAEDLTKFLEEFIANEKAKEKAKLVAELYYSNECFKLKHELAKNRAIIAEGIEIVYLRALGDPNEKEAEWLKKARTEVRRSAE